jgi:hypothetical protein
MRRGLRALAGLLVLGCSREGEPRRVPERAAATSTPSAASAPSAPSAPRPSPAAPKPHRAEARRVLHFGDSMVPLVGNYLKPVYERQGSSYRMLSTRSSTTRTFSDHAGLSAALREYDPDLVLISLGSNELFERELGAVATAVRAIVRQVGDRPCLWISPPAWAKGYGFLDTLRESVAPCDHFDSSRLPFSRQADGRHPDWSSSYRWASEVWRALGGTAPVPSQ